MSGAHPAAEVATRTRIVDVQIAHAFIGKEAPNCIFKFASIDDIRAVGRDWRISASVKK